MEYDLYAEVSLIEADWDFDLDCLDDPEDFYYEEEDYLLEDE